MKKIMLLMLALMLCVHYVAAEVIVTEVMYAPTQTESETDGEWVEIYNNGESGVDLTVWTLDGYNFEDVTISPGEYIVIARELIDTDDEDLESFETAWGNGDGVWDNTDGTYTAVDGYFTLATEDTIVLSNGNYTETFTYNTSYGANGNGNSLARINYSLPNTIDNWAEQESNPGSGNIQEASEEDVILIITINNSAPEIIEIVLSPDNSQEEGVQIMPNINSPKTVEVEIMIEDLNGFDDVTEVQIEVNNQIVELNFNSNSSATQSLFNGSFNMQYSDLAGDYQITATVSDGKLQTQNSTSFKYLAIISTVLDTSELDFSTLNPGEISTEQILTISNTGNTGVDINVQGTDLVGQSGTLNVENVEYYFNNEWFTLSKTGTELDLNLLPQAQSELMLRINVPAQTKSDNYVGALQITSVVS
ncbi:MAG: lamin tail domain-containing protein [archaeon]